MKSFLYYYLLLLILTIFNCKDTCEPNTEKEGNSYADCQKYEIGSDYKYCCYVDIDYIDKKRNPQVHKGCLAYDEDRYNNIDNDKKAIEDNAYKFNKYIVVCNQDEPEPSNQAINFIYNLKVILLSLMILLF